MSSDLGERDSSRILRCFCRLRLDLFVPMQGNSILGGSTTPEFLAAGTWSLVKVHSGSSCVVADRRRHRLANFRRPGFTEILGESEH